MTNNISLDFTDFQTILSHKGKIEGVISSCKADEFMSVFDKNLKLLLQRAKGVLVEFEWHTDSSLTLISSFMEEVYTLISADADVIFITKENDILDKDTINFKIIATGIAQ